MNNYRISTIEILPIELLTIILTYLSANDLFNIFYHLNDRFRSIIHSLQHLSFTLEENWDDQQSEIPFYSSHITILVVKHDEFVDFKHFPNIHSLKLCMPTFDQCNSITPHSFPHLKNLYISNFYYNNHTEQLSNFIFSSSFPLLRSLHMNRMKLTQLSPIYPFSLQQLTISPCTWNSNFLPVIFRACPKLALLRMTHLRNIPFEINVESIPSQTSIYHLCLHFDVIEKHSCDQIDAILALVPNLHTFTIIIDAISNNLEFSSIHLRDIVYKRIPYLVNFKVRKVCENVCLSV